MSTRARVWWVYAIVSVLLVGALTWASASVATLERRNDENTAMAQRQEAIRAALWRLDSRVSTLIALEAARPAPAHRALIQSGGIGEGAQPLAKGYFEYGRTPDPSASDAATRAIARRTRSAQTGAPKLDKLMEASEDDQGFSELTASAEEELRAADYQARRQLAQPIQSAEPQGPDALSDRAPARASSGYAQDWSRVSSVSAVEPVWVRAEPGEPQLVLVRTIVDAQGELTQGVWLDWDALSRELLALIRDLLPTSTLRPIAPGTQGVEGYRLATIPVEFVPGGAAALPPSRVTPAILALLITWVAVLASLVAGAFVLRAVMGLSERRARFVSAVTHELRTPLTTFRLYAQMLADGMVTDEQVRREYLGTLRRESDRLTGIVENVLEYARLTRRRTGSPLGERTLSVGELMALIVPPMSRRAEESGMDLVVSDETGSRGEARLTLDPGAVERVVMNLTDNACKYATVDEGADQDTRIHLDARVVGDTLSLLVADHGPGVAPRDRRRVFGEFVRGTKTHTKDRSGLGLGLALSRGLAREMGGDLALVRRRGHGAEFELTLPIDQR